MKKDYSRVGLPNLLETKDAKTAEPAVIVEPVVDKVESIVNKEEPKNKKKTKEEQPKDEVAEASAE